MGILHRRILFLTLLVISEAVFPLYGKAQPSPHTSRKLGEERGDSSKLTEQQYHGSGFIEERSSILNEESTLGDSAIPFSLPPLAELSRVKSALIKTERGDIIVELFPDEAPWHVANFKFLADRGFYAGKSFDIVSKDYIAQGGRPTIAEQREYSYTLPPEFSNRTHTAGSLGMARVPDRLKNLSRRSSATQFHFLLQDDRRMDGSYTMFGRVLRGMSVLPTLSPGTRIQSVTVYIE